MISTSTRPERRRALRAERKMGWQQRSATSRQDARLRRARPSPFTERSIYTGDVLQEIARQQAAGNREFSGRQFAIKAHNWAWSYLMGRAS